MASMHGLMLPALDAALACSVVHCGLSGQVEAGGQVPVVIAVSVRSRPGRAPGQLLAGRAAVDVVLGVVDEVLLAEAAVGLGPGGQRLGHEGVTPCLRRPGSPRR